MKYITRTLAMSALLGVMAIATPPGSGLALAAGAAALAADAGARAQPATSVQKVQRRLKGAGVHRGPGGGGYVVKKKRNNTARNVAIGVVGAAAALAIISGAANANSKRGGASCATLLRRCRNGNDNACDKYEYRCDP